MNFTVPSVLTFWATWFAMCIAMALLSGWGTLAGRFDGGSAVGQRFYLVSGAVSQWPWLPIQYLMTFVLTINEQGFRMAVLFTMRLLHKPFTVPWSSVSEMRQEPFLKVFRQTVVKVGDRQIIVRGRAGKALINAWEAYGQV
jgi:hypothetical protein